MWLCMLVACCLCLLKNMLNNSFYFSCFFQSGKKTVKAVLWVSADGLRVVDDKTKVSKHICVCVCHPFLLVSSSPLFSLSTYLITHRATGTRGGGSLCPTVMYDYTQHRCFIGLHPSPLPTEIEYAGRIKTEIPPQAPRCSCHLSTTHPSLRASFMFSHSAKAHFPSSSHRQKGHSAPV